MKYKLFSYLFLFTVSVMLISSCQNRHKEVLNRKKMEQVMYDVYIAEAIIENDYQNFDTPEKKEAYISKIFNKHNISQAQWDSSLAWYSDRIDVYLRMNDSVKSRLQREQKGIEKKLNAELAKEQASTLRFTSPSYIPRFYTLASDMSDGLRFRLDSAEIYTKITDADFSFRFNVLGISPATAPEFRSLLILAYKDTTIYQSLNITQNDFYRIPASKYITGDTLRSISGFVRLNNNTGNFRNVRLYNIALGDELKTGIQPPVPHTEAAAPVAESPTQSLQNADTLK